MPVDPIKARDLFLHAVGKLPPDQWDACVAKACGDNAELAAHVRHMLQVHRDADRFMEVPVAELAETTDQPIREGPGTVIGNCKLLEQIGEGGFGMVFMAQQSHPIQRKVALKILKPGMDSRQIVARFEAERQALALMDHPNIARIFDGGETASGRPYFVMELVRGIPITDYCDQSHLSVRERLGLFIAVCQAVQHAHQKGVIHRDLKPSNILVTMHDDRAQVKVIDFGIAKAIGQQLTEKTLFTNFAQMIGTPLYMSPEQAQMSALDVDTRTDIYALGVLLYELLTGTTPFDKVKLKTAGFDEIRRIIREDEPDKPSTRLSTMGFSARTASANRKSDPKRLSQLLRGELDWIAMKALEKNRDRRYESASDFAADLHRYLTNEPVLARAPTMSYKLRKFLQRNQAPVLAAGLVLLALFAGIAATSWSMLNARDAERRARDEQAKALQEADNARRERDDKEKARAEAVNANEREKKARQEADEITDVALEDLRSTTDDAEKRLGRETLTDADRAFLRGLLARFERLARVQGDSPKNRAIRAEGHFRSGNIHKHLGEWGQAKKAYELARELNRSLTNEFPAAPTYREHLAKSQANLASVLMREGDSTTAETELREAVSLFKQLAANFPDQPDYRRGLFGAHLNLGNLLDDRNKFTEAESEFGEALKLAKQLVAEFPRRPEHGQDQADAHNNLAVSLKHQQKYRAAEREYREAIRVRKQLTADHQKVPAYRDGLAAGHLNLAILLRNLGNSAEAEGEYREALALRKALVAEFPAIPKYREALAGCHNELAILLDHSDKPKEADAEFDEANRLRKQLADSYPGVPRYEQDLAQCHNNLGLRLMKQKKWMDAEAEFRESLRLKKQLADKFPNLFDYRRDLAGTHRNLGALFEETKKWSEAVSEYKAALALLEKTPADFQATLDYAFDLGAIYFSFGFLMWRSERPAEAVGWCDRAIQTLGSVLAKEPRLATARDVLSNSHLVRAEACMKLQRFAEALKDWDRSIELQPAQKPSPDSLLKRALCLVHIEPARAIAAIDNLVKSADLLPVHLYDAACIVSLASAGVSDAGKQNEFAAKAVHLLKHARSNGFFKDKENVEHAKKDSDLASLRQRPDFQQLMKELENPMK